MKFDLFIHPGSGIDRGKVAPVYTQGLSYASAGASRISINDQAWHSGADTYSDHAEYVYDELGRLRESTGQRPGSYQFDELGRLSEKREGPGGYAMTYNTGSYQPSTVAGVGANTTLPIALHKYDQSGNRVADRRTHSLYRVNADGQPFEVRKYSATSYPTTATVAQIAAGTSFGGEELLIEMSYDESGNRVWRSVRDLVSGSSRTEVVVPGVGVYVSIDGESTWELERLDLVAGGVREKTGEAYFPVQDAQGSIKGYAVQMGGLASVYTYDPYGRVHGEKEITANLEDRWQSKRWDSEYEFYYFGARYFDPVLGLWNSPDPARQFANPYAYGGDPINGVDRDGRCVDGITTWICIGAAVGFVASIGAEAYHQGKDDWWKVNKYDWSHVAKSTVAGGALGALTYGGVVAATSGYGLEYAAASIAGLSMPSYLGRMLAPDNDNRWGTTKDYFSGGMYVNGIGHLVGLTNASLGGDYDWYNGFMVYSGGPVGGMMPHQTGFAHFGHAIFLDDRDYERGIAHEIRHGKQMEKKGNRFAFQYEYVINENKWGLSSNEPNYSRNAYEMDAYYTDWLYDNKYVDVYGKTKHGKNVTSAELNMFKNVYLRYFAYSKYVQPTVTDWQRMQTVGPSY